ncbi:hypothetical protein AMATHDRAFT_104838, partial [Amanita thiersii Skay4041]
WVTRRIWSESKGEAVRTLQQYAHNKQTPEVTESLINELNMMSESEALMAIYELKQRPTTSLTPTVVRTLGNNQMDVRCIISTTDTLETFEVKALLDSGCTGSCVNREFVEKHRLNTTPLPRPIPVYNA